MAIRIVQLGSRRAKNEGVRIGTVRRPPRGVPKARFAKDDWYDVWLPILSPAPETVKIGLTARTPGEWQRFERQFRREMKAADASRTLDLLAALSHGADFSLGCYCEDEARCHRSLLRALLAERGAKVL